MDRENEVGVSDQLLGHATGFGPGYLLPCPSLAHKSTQPWHLYLETLNDISQLKVFGQLLIYLVTMVQYLSDGTRWDKSKMVINRKPCPWNTSYLDPLRPSSHHALKRGFSAEVKIWTLGQIAWV